MFRSLFDIERVIHSIKTAIACLIGFLLAKLVGIPADQWIVISIIVVMCAQIYVGSVMQKAYLRFLGTVTGCLFATIAIISFGATPLVIAATIALSSLCFSYVATSQESMSYAGSLGAVTTAIIMLGQKPTVLFASERFLEISVGILIATLVSQFILPIHARTHLRRSQAETLEQLRDYYTACMVTHTLDIEALRYMELDESIVKSLSNQRKLAKEAKHEPLGKFYDPAQFLKTLHFEKEILRSIDFMHNAMIHLPNADILLTSAAINTFNDTIIQSLNALIKAIDSNAINGLKMHNPCIDSLKNEVLRMVSTTTQQDRIYVDGFLFSAETLVSYLEKLAILYRLPVYNS